MAKKYEARINLDVDNAHSRVIRLVGRDKRVLELGCASGYMSHVLADSFGCTVTGVELHAEAARQAREFCIRVIEADLDTVDWTGVLGDDSFDVIIAADVLEHVRKPVALLEAVRSHLADGGYLVASIPNLAHASVLVELLNGRFFYQPYGLLDDTHIRFFTRDTIFECFERAGFAVSHLERIVVPPEQTEFRTDLSALSVEVRALLESRDESHTYQFILTAHPVSAGNTVEWSRATPSVVGRPSTDSDAASRRPESPFDEAFAGPIQGFLQAVNGRIAFLDDGRQHQTELIGRLREQLLRSEIHIGSLTSDVQRCREMVTSLRGELEAEGKKHEGPSNVVDELRRAHDVTARRLIVERMRLGDAVERAQRERDLLAEQIGDRDNVARQRDEAHHELVRHTSHIEQMTVQIQQLTAGLQQSTARIDQYERSRSWRYTAPMRAAFRALGSLKRTRS
jgi:2-polyprenyl-3-methyl-5-hydroxy-6-metoxy-1,4-benzoquinol methylase